MNENELTPAEHADVRARLIAGAGRIAPVGRHRNAWIAGSVAVALVAVIAGGVGVGATLSAPPVMSTPSPTATQTVPTPTPTPTPSPTDTQSPPPPAATVASSAFGGDCDAALSVAEASTAMGVDMYSFEPTWVDPAERVAGGLRCVWYQPDMYSWPALTLFVYPVSEMPEPHRSAASECLASASWCELTAIVGDAWVRLSVKGAVDLDAARAAFALVTSRVAQTAPPVPDTGGGTARWMAIDCAQLGANVDVAGALGWAGADPLTYEQVEPVGDAPAVPPLSWWTLPTVTGAEEECNFRSPNGEAVGIAFVAGADGYLGSVVASASARPVDVAGAVTAVVVDDNDPLEGHQAPLLASDGTNVLSVSLNVLDEDEGGVRRAALAAAVLEWLRR
jgi:hypothetical protein